MDMSFAFTMNDITYLSAVVVMFVAQMMLCWKVNRFVVRFLPIIAALTLIAVSFVLYAISGWSNWGWLIILVVEVFVLWGAVFGLIVGSILRKKVK